MIDEEPEIESSPLCTSVTQDGTTVQVEIYRLADKGNRWSLEVVDEEGASTVWSTLSRLTLKQTLNSVERWNRRISSRFLRLRPVWG